MADVLEQMRIWQRRIRRRRWLGLAVAWATCALGWTALGLLGAEGRAGGAGLAASAILLGGIAGGVGAALVAAREPVFDGVEQLRWAFDRPVLGSIADMTARSSARAGVGFVMACIGLLGTFAALLVVQALAPEAP